MAQKNKRKSKETRQRYTDEFKDEAVQMMLDGDTEVVTEIAEVPELSFLKHTSEAWPNFTNLQSVFVAREPYTDGVAVVTEICRYPDSSTSRQSVLAAETQNGW